MNTFSNKLIQCTLAMALSSFGWAADPCMPIAKACMQLGYYKGGNNLGKGLLINCIIPVATNQKILTNATFSPAVLQQCNAMIMAKMKSR